MEIEHLRAFAQVAGDGSFSKAARHLDVSQPSISARIAALEREMGGQLFRRGGRLLALTELGESFLPYVERSLATLHEGVESVRLTGTGQRGRVTVGTIQPLCGDFLGRAVQRFQAGHPQVDLFVRVGHSEQVVEMLHDRVVRVGVIGEHSSPSPVVEVICRVRQPLVLIVPADSPFALRQEVRLADLVEAAPPLYFIGWTSRLRPLVAEALQSPPLAWTMVEIPFEMAHRFVLGGHGATLATRAMVADDTSVGRLHAVPLANMPLLYYENAVVRLKGVALPRVVDEFVEMLRVEAQATSVEHG